MNFQKHDLDEYSELMGEMLNVSSISLIKMQDAATSRAEVSAKENVNNGTAEPVKVTTVNTFEDSTNPNNGNYGEVDLDPEPAAPLDAYGCFYRNSLDMYMKMYPGCFAY